MSQKVLGVLGGMGPAASAEFMRILSFRFPAEKDQDHPVVFMLSDPKIPDRTSAIIGDGEDPEPYIRKDIERLMEWGADLLAVPCNTAHCFINRFKDEIKTPIVHIVEATLSEAAAKAVNGAWMASSIGTAKAGIYQAEAEKMGYRLLLPPEDVRWRMQEAIKFVKAGDLKHAAEVFESAAEGLWRIEDIPIITACTELPLAYEASRLPFEKNISSLDALADACIREILS